MERAEAARAALVRLCGTSSAALGLGALTVAEVGGTGAGALGAAVGAGVLAATGAGDGVGTDGAAEGAAATGCGAAEGASG